MGNNAGQLLWSRLRITLPVIGQAPSETDVDTGLTQLNQSFGADSVGEPSFGTSGVAPPPAGTLPASRVQVIPQSPLGAWDLITHSEPYFNTTTNTIHVVFFNSNVTPSIINVLFWAPHTSIGPGQADTYHPLGS
jgi:hypothetical protein